jgi:uncharacterized protein YoxC
MDDAGYFEHPATAAGRIEGYAEGVHHGQEVGFLDGKLVGKEQGYQFGFNDGFAAGDQAGWNRCIDEWTASQHVTNTTISTLNTRIADLEGDSLRNPQEMIELRHMVRSLNETKDLLENRVRKLETENRALTTKNEALEHKVKALDTALQERTAKLNEVIKDCNRCMVFANSMRKVAEELTSTPDSPVAERIYREFDKHYQAFTAHAMKEGSLSMPLHRDEGLAKTMPKTFALIQRMLKEAADLKAVEQPLEHDDLPSS